MAIPGQKKKRDMRSVTDLLAQKAEEIKRNTEKKDKNTFVSQEFQDYGLRLAHRLGDFKHKALYIKYARALPRAIVEDAAAYASDYPKAKSKAKLFMWKIHDLISEYNAKHPDKKISLAKIHTKKSAKKKKASAPKKSKRELLAEENLSLF